MATCAGEATVLIDRTGRKIGIHDIKNCVVQKRFMCDLKGFIEEIQNGKILVDYKVILLHCGTRDLVKIGEATFVQQYLKVVSALKTKNLNCKIAISAILPRYSNSPGVNLKVGSINQQLRELCKEDSRLLFVDVSKLVIEQGTVKPEPFEEDGFTVTEQFSSQLRNRFQQAIATLLGRCILRSKVTFYNYLIF